MFTPVSHWLSEYYLTWNSLQIVSACLLDIDSHRMHMANHAYAHACDCLQVVFWLSAACLVVPASFHLHAPPQNPGVMHVHHKAAHLSHGYTDSSSSSKTIANSTGAPLPSLLSPAVTVAAVASVPAGGVAAGGLSLGNASSLPGAEAEAVAAASGKAASAGSAAGNVEAADGKDLLGVAATATQRTAAAPTVRDEHGLLRAEAAEGGVGPAAATGGGRKARSLLTISGVLEHLHPVYELETHAFHHAIGMLQEACPHRVLAYSGSVGGQVRSHILASVPLQGQHTHQKRMRFEEQKGALQGHQQQQGWPGQKKRARVEHRHLQQTTPPMQHSSAGYGQREGMGLLARDLHQQEDEGQQQKKRQYTQHRRQPWRKHHEQDPVQVPSQVLDIPLLTLDGQQQEQLRQLPVTIVPRSGEHAEQKHSQHQQQQDVLGLHPTNVNSQVQQQQQQGLQQRQHRRQERAIVPLDGAGKVQLLAFCCFEVLIGVFWPTMMTLRAEHVPEHERSTIMNVFRIPLNLFVCIILWKVSIGCILIRLTEGLRLAI